MGPKSRRSGASEEGSSDIDAALEERKASGNSAEQSGRVAGEGERLFLDTNRARKDEREDWNREAFCVPASRKMMIELPAGSNIYFQGYAEQWSNTEVYCRIPQEKPRDTVWQWLRLTSSRLRLSGGSWTCLNKKEGSWEPNLVTNRPKGKKAKKRKLKAANTQDGDATTGTTRAAHDSEVEDDAGNSPSPRPVKGSNAVSPDAEGFAVALNRQSKPVTSAGIEIKVKPDPDAQLERAPQASSGQQLERIIKWMGGHYTLLKQRGKFPFNSHEGYNPEAGRMPKTAQASSDRSAQGSLKAEQPSSSFSSAAKDRGGSTHSTVAPGILSGSKGELRVPEGRKGQLLSDSDELASSRSTSPATPLKNGDGARESHRQRSSSIDGSGAANPHWAKACPAPTVTTRVPVSERKNVGGQKMAAANTLRALSKAAPAPSIGHSQQAAPSWHPTAQGSRKTNGAPLSGGGYTTEAQRLGGNGADTKWQKPGQRSKLVPRPAGQLAGKRSLEDARAAPIPALLDADPFAVTEPKKKRMP